VSGTSSPASGLRRGVLSMIAWIALYMLTSAALLTALPKYVPPLAQAIADYSTYISVGISLFFGYMIVRSFAGVIYWALRFRYPHPTASTVRSLVGILGIGAMLSAIAGGTAGGAP